MQVRDAQRGVVGAAEPRPDVCAAQKMRILEKLWSVNNGSVLKQYETTVYGSIDETWVARVLERVVRRVLKEYHCVRTRDIGCVATANAQIQQSARGAS